MYFTQKLSTVEIQKKTGLVFGTVRNLFRENGIKTRDLSEGAKVMIEQKRNVGGQGPNYVHGKHVSWQGVEVFYRSSYELEFAKYLDLQKIPYLMEFLRIRYFDVQKNCYRIAIPDFYLPGTNELVEIKSRFTLNMQNMKDKFKAYREAGYSPKLILEHKEKSIF